MTRDRLTRLSVTVCVVVVAGAARADTPFATTIIDFYPAPGQFVNDDLYDDPIKALGCPFGDNPEEPNNESLVSLGGFGGSITLGFDHTIRDDPANPFGLDAIVYGNSLWVTGNPNRKWGECGSIEISRDANSNGSADDPWYLIPGSHITDPTGQHEEQTWDVDVGDPVNPPADESWIPPGRTGVWTTEGYRLPAAVFETVIMENPNGPDAVEEGVFGYADFSPTQALPDGVDAEVFYTRPDNPFEVGLTDGCGGGDGFDIAWAIDPATGEPANLNGFDFIRLTTTVNRVVWDPPFGELSTEINAVADAAEGRFGDAENDGDVDLDDFAIFGWCLSGAGKEAPTSPCRVMDFDQDGDVDLADYAKFQVEFTGS